MEKLIGKRYAEALFEAALELDKLEEFKQEIIGIADVFNNESKLKTIFEHPKLSKNEKKDIINSLFSTRVSQEMINLMYIIIDKGREGFINDIKDAYVKLSNEQQGIIEATAITAVSMSEDEITNLQTKLSEKLGKKVILSNIIDDKIIGGVLVRVEDKVIDNSIKGKLEVLEKSLNNLRVSR